MNIELKDIVPRGATIKLSMKNRTYRLRAVTLDDEIWMNETFGSTLEDIFKNLKMKEVCKIVFHQMEEEDKQDFLAIDVEFINEKGEKLLKRMGGSDLLMIHILGYSEKIALYEALMETIGLSRPLQKKLSEEEKKSSPLPIGPKSSISSPMNTDGPLKKFSGAPRKKYRSGSQRLEKGRT